MPDLYNYPECHVSSLKPQPKHSLEGHNEQEGFHRDEKGIACAYFSFRWVVDTRPLTRLLKSGLPVPLIAIAGSDPLPRAISRVARNLSTI